MNITFAEKDYIYLGELFIYLQSRTKGQGYNQRCQCLRLL